MTVAQLDALALAAGTVQDASRASGPAEGSSEDLLALAAIAGGA